MLALAIYNVGSTDGIQWEGFGLDYARDILESINRTDLIRDYYKTQNAEEFSLIADCVHPSDYSVLHTASLHV